MARKIVTVAPLTPDGDLHLGHIAGAYLAADVYARARRLRGDEVVLVSYTDEYQSHATHQDSDDGDQSFMQSRSMSQTIADTFGMIGIELDGFLYAERNACFHRWVSRFYDAAAASGNLYRKSERIPYLPEQDRHHYEDFDLGDYRNFFALVNDSECQNALTPLERAQRAEAGDDEQPDTQWRLVEREFLRLNAYRIYLDSLYTSRTLRPPLDEFFSEVLSLPGIDWGVTCPHAPGIALERPGQPERAVIHAQFCGIAGYFAAFQEWAERQQQPQLVDTYLKNRKTSLVHFFGFDWAFSHAVVYPVLLTLMDGFHRDVQLYANSFLKLDGEKMSNSRGQVIGVRDMLETYAPEAVRYYLALNSPEEEACGFDMTDFARWYEQLYCGRLNRLRDSLSEMLDDVRKIAIAAQDMKRWFGLLREWRKHTSEGCFSMRKMAHTCAEMLDWIAATAARRPSDAAMLLAAYALLASPIHPVWSKQFLRRIGLDAASAQAWLNDAVEEATAQPVALETEFA